MKSEVLFSSGVLEKREPRGKGKEKVPAFQLASNIEQWTDLRKVFEERILDSRVEFSLRELYEFHDLLLDLVKRKRKSTEEPGSTKVNTNAVLMTDVGVEDELSDSHYRSLIGHVQLPKLQYGSVTCEIR